MPGGMYGLRSMAAARLNQIAISWSRAALVCSKVDALRCVSSSAASPQVKPWWQAVCQPFRAAANSKPGLGAITSRVHVCRQAFATSAGTEGEAGLAVAEETGFTAPAAVRQRAYVKTKKLTKQVKHIMQLLDKEAVEGVVKQKPMPDIKPGDIVQLRVEVPENKRRVSVLKGIVIAKRNAGISSTFRIRRVLAGVGVEVVYPLYSPNIKEIKVIGNRKVRRAKLYYLRDKIAKLSTF